MTTPSSQDCGPYAPTGNGLYALQRHLLTGLWWDAYRVVGTNAYKLWSAFGSSYDDMSAWLCTLVRELNPFTTDQMISEWERALGLPDPCLPIAASMDERRAWVIFRLAKKRWTTAPEWHELAALFGLEIRITPGWYVQKPALYGFEYPKRYDVFPRLGRFRVYIDMLGLNAGGYAYGAAGGGEGYPVPYGLDAPTVSAFQCLIERVKPANVVVIWNANPLDNYCTAETFEGSFDETFCGELTGEA